ncbi:hypothetical protein [Fusicatenibacter saccharivorans]|uniref:hypothetical protein n=1 Tax=Fusicatenibacter saccharivorans TaxID=1150298 RepID=UPI0022DF90D8|nr:hypothetical protein [Fusicatenibacter saccharivorans]
MTLEQYMRELWLMDKQYGQEEELYPLINMLLRDGVNTENLSIRDVNKSERIKADNNKNVKSRKYIDGFGSFPDLAIFDESFPDLSDEENIVSNLKKIYGCVEAKCIGKDLIEFLDLNTTEIICEKNEEDNWIGYYGKKNKIILNKSKGGANDAGQLLGELLWYGKVLYTNGVIWKYYKLSEKSEEIINAIRIEWISADSNNGDTLQEEKKKHKTWIFEQCKEENLEITIKSEEIGNLTEIYEKIKDKPSIPTFDSKDYDKWKIFKTNLATINWKEVIF